MFLAPAWNVDFGFTVVCLHLSPHQAEGPPVAQLLSCLCLWPAHSWHSRRHLGRGPRPRTLRNSGNRLGHSPAVLGARLVEGTSWWRWGPAELASLGSPWRSGEGKAARGLGGSQHQPSPLASLVALSGTAGRDPGLLLLLISPALMRRERASSEECRPVCTRKPKPSPRGVAG